MKQIIIHKYKSYIKPDNRMVYIKEINMKNKNKTVTLNSKIGELYATPVGHDTIAKVLMQLGIPETAVTNPVVSNLKLKPLPD